MFNKLSYKKHLILNNQNNQVKKYLEKKLNHNLIILSPYNNPINISYPQKIQISLILLIKSNLMLHPFNINNRYSNRLSANQDNTYNKRKSHSLTSNIAYLHNCYRFQKNIQKEI